MNDEEIVDGEFEEIIERDVRLTSDLTDEELEQLKNTNMSEEHDHLNAEVSPEDAAAFAKEFEAAQKDLDVVAAPSERQLTQSEMIQAIKNATKEGVLSSSKKQRLLQEMGIYKSTFTKKQASKTSSAKKRKQQKKARRKNRK